MKITVPATSANLGCGFDSVGFAVNLYLELDVLGPSREWAIAHDLGAHIPQDATNIIISTALSIAPNIPPHSIKMTSAIPQTGGLGSSSSALVAGIMLASALGGAQLSSHEKLQLACKLEGHADNVAPAILGGLVISTYSNGSLEYIKAPMQNAGLVAYVPGYRLPTKLMREILPQELPYDQAVLASSISNVMVASLVQGDIQKAARLMEQDMFHEKYRAKHIPELSEVREIARKHGAYGTYLSGSGSAIMCIADESRVRELAVALQARGDARVLELELEAEGARVRPA